MMPELHLTLAQTAEPTLAILKWLGVLVGVSVLIAVAGLLARRLLVTQDDDAGVDPGFTLADLRQMHADGDLTDEEFAAAKARMIAHSRAALHDDEAVTDVSTNLSTGVPPSDVRNNGPEKADDSPQSDNRDDDAAQDGTGTIPR